MRWRISSSAPVRGWPQPALPTEREPSCPPAQLGYPPVTVGSRSGSNGSVTTPRRITFLVWRDTAHPDGGGSEVYVEHMARWLAGRGHDVTICCAEHANAPRDEVRDGVRFRRRGGWLSVYPRGLAYLLSRPAGAPTSWSTCTTASRSPPRWSAAGGCTCWCTMCTASSGRSSTPAPGAGSAGGWSPGSRPGSTGAMTTSPCRSPASGPGRAGHRPGADLGGLQRDRRPHPSRLQPRSPSPRICVLGRLVPHKQFEHALIRWPGCGRACPSCGST